MIGVLEPGARATEVDVMVTEDDKVGAKRRSIKDCPVCRACRAALGLRFHSVAVDGRVVVRNSRGRLVDCECPEQAALAAWIRVWDDGGDPGEIVVTLRVPR